MKNRKKLALLLVVLMAFSIGLAGCGGGGDTDAEGGVIKLTVGAGHPETSMPYVKAGNEFFVAEVERRVAEETDYTIEWTTAYGGSIAKLAEVFGAVENGLLDVGFICPAFEPANLFLQNITYSIPFNTPDATQCFLATKATYEAFPEVFNAAFEAKNQKLLGIGGVGNYQLISTFPIDELADLSNVAVAAAGPNLPLLNGTGAVPIQGDLTEAYSSFETGVYDAWIMYPASSYGFKLHEVAPYQTDMNFGSASVGLITINQEVYDSLPPEVQQIMIEVGDEYSVENGELANKVDSDGLENMMSEGLTLVELKDGEIQAYAASLENLPLKFAMEAESKGFPGYDIVRFYIERLEAEGYVFPRDWLVDFPQ